MEENFLPTEPLNDEETIAYFVDRRDKELERLNKRIKQYGNYNEESIRTAFDSVLRISKQLKLVEDARIIHRLTQVKYTSNLQPMRCSCHPSLPKLFINRFCTRCGGTKE